MNQSNIKVTPLSPAIGAELHGIDLSKPFSDSIFDEIRQCLHEHLLIIFREQTLSPRKHRDFTARFFDLESHPLVESISGYPEIIAIVKESIEYKNWGGPWHVDVTFTEASSIGAVLYVCEVPPCGGDTLFANMYFAYEALSKGLKSMLQTLRAVHYSGDPGRFYTDFKGMRPKSASVESATHPVVRTHPVTGRKSLFVNRMYTRHFEGMTEEESRPLLEMLFDHAQRPEFTCRLHWRQRTLALWDNRVTLHHAMDDDFEAMRTGQGFRRVLHRATLAGQRPV